ncbi:Hypothetical protein A7982_11000 [Minicystis rosea]|nr:Hypothetical protein A7982_11000 [Minicystis rosea]
MALPASLLAAAEAHACFTGCYSHETPVALCIDAARPPVTSFHAACQDCLMFHLGALASLLPPGMTQYGLAQELAAHMRSVRGYRWAISGYHATGQGFWLSAAYYGDGLFLVDGSRNHGGARDVDLLVQAFRSKLVQPDDQGMLDPALYASEIVHLSCSPPLGMVKTKQDILRSPQCSLSPRQGLRRVCIVEFLPLTTMTTNHKSPPPPAVKPPPPPSPPAVRSPSPPAVVRPPARTLRVGDVCPACGAEVKERPLFSGTFVGCLC